MAVGAEAVGEAGDTDAGAAFGVPWGTVTWAPVMPLPRDLKNGL